MYVTEKPQTSSPILTLKPCKNDGGPRIFLKLNYHTKYPFKNNNTDPCLRANDQKMVCQTLACAQQYFQNTLASLISGDNFQTCLIQKQMLTYH